MSQQTYENLTIQKRGLHELNDSTVITVYVKLFEQALIHITQKRSYCCIVIGEISIFIGRLSQENAISLLTLFQALFSKSSMESFLSYMLIQD